MQPTAEQLSAVMALYDAGQMLGAHRLAESYAPLRQWRGAAGRVVAGRLALNLGAPHFGRVSHRLAHREDPTHPEATYYAAREIHERLGPLPAWQFLAKHGDLPAGTPNVRADWFSFPASVLTMLRDFDGAGP